jgi:hypothetical protein
MKNMEITCPYCGNNERIKKNGHYRKERGYTDAANAVKLSDCPIKTKE